ncbi:sensor histidine kinase [Candidatus Laterigemmans baculatus]|uniref:sensor histidine kinase n=1 Tax=Candidatus Laterigemmans baculatus TaxID=2770505 RepID=UPI0013DB215B|nr:HAMP domain-containing sensor histidine kinase [Candidatus Laterigemmans baculatus]
MVKTRFRSLRTRLLIPLIGGSMLAALAVGGVSYVLGDRVVQRSMNSRFEAIRSTLSTATFPLTPTVLKTLAELTETELASYDPRGQRIESSFAGAPATLPAASLATASQHPGQLEDSPRPQQEPQQGLPHVAPSDGFDSRLLAGYQTRHFSRRRSADDPAAVAHVLVMFDERDLQEARLAAASLPLATGLSSTLLLSIVALALTERMIHRIAALERNVKRIAAGEFQPRRIGGEPDADAAEELDELGRLGAAVRGMGDELAILWEAVHRQERQKLIHQIAAGLAHQLRNSLTGARMAVELHARRCPRHPNGDDLAGDGLEVALRELERTEDYVQRILRIASQPGAAAPAASPDAAPAAAPDAAPAAAPLEARRGLGGRSEAGEAGTVGEATAAVRESLQVVADHQHVTLDWKLDAAALEQRVADRASLTAALENLVLNALQSGGEVVGVEADCVAGQVQIKVTDNGPGPSEAVGEELFEPFVTSKPEGLGLGLAVVRRSAEDLGGSVRWFRSDHQTVFVLTVAPLA